MTWSTPADLRAQLLRLWERGELLRAIDRDSDGWPLRLRLRAPTAAEITDRFAEVRDWRAALAAMPRIRLVEQEVRHRVHGSQRLPAEACIDRVEDAVAIIGKRTETETWRQLRDATSSRLPMLLPWLQRHPLRAIDLSPAWPRLLSTLEWLRDHPRPGVYLRQVDAAGVDSKFIEAHRAVLTELLDLALPADAIDTAATGVNGFTRRYGFLEKPVRVRFRTLDPALKVFSGQRASADVTLDARNFAALDLPVRRVFVTENETNFLAFPTVTESILLFGAGYGWDYITSIEWLSRRDVFYWGDIDTHGFAILDQLRAHLPHVTSLLMDRATFVTHQAHWTHEPEPTRHALTRLSPDELALYDDLRYDRLGERLRLEQERIGFAWLNSRLAEIVA